MIDWSANNWGLFFLSAGGFVGVVTTNVILIIKATEAARVVKETNADVKATGEHTKVELGEIKVVATEGREVATEARDLGNHALGVQLRNHAITAALLYKAAPTKENAALAKMAAEASRAHEESQRRIDASKVAVAHAASSVPSIVPPPSAAEEDMRRLEGGALKVAEPVALLNTNFSAPLAVEPTEKRKRKKRKAKKRK